MDIKKKGEVKNLMEGIAKRSRKRRNCWRFEREREREEREGRSMSGKDESVFRLAMIRILIKISMNVTTQPIGWIDTRTWISLKPPRPVVSVTVSQPNPKAHLGPIQKIQLDRVWP